MNQLDLYNIRIDVAEDDPEVCWIFMLEGTQAVEGGRFKTADLMNHILKFYNKEY